MRATDLQPTRAFAAKAAARNFVDAVPEGTHVGIVSFADSALGVVAPTADLDAVREGISRIPPPDGATAIGDALALAARELPERGRRAIVLLTDGVNNRGADPLETSRAIGARGIAIYTVGIGTRGSGQLVPGTADPADLDEDALRTIAANGGGAYAAASDTDSLSRSFRAIALATVWEKKRVDGTVAFALGGGFLLLGTLLGGLALGRFP
jgi:hypothetical protein